MEEFESAMERLRKDSLIHSITRIPGHGFAPNRYDLSMPPESYEQVFQRLKEIAAIRGINMTYSHRPELADGRYIVTVRARKIG